MPTKSLNQIRRRAFGDDLPMVHNREAITDPFRFIHVMSGEQHCAAAALKLANDVPELPPALRIEPSGRLIQEKQLRRTHESGGNGEPLPLSAREFSDP